MAHGLLDILNKCDDEVSETFYDSLVKNGQRRIVDPYLNELEPSTKRRRIEGNFFSNYFTVMIKCLLLRRQITSFYTGNRKSAPFNLYNKRAKCLGYLI